MLSALKEVEKRIPSQRDRIVNLLLKRGERGATNEELSKISLAYQTRIFELTEQGYVFKLKSLGEWLVNYTLVSVPTTPSPPRTPIKDIVIESINEDYGGLMDVSSLHELLEHCNAFVSRKSVVVINRAGEDE